MKGLLISMAVIEKKIAMKREKLTTAIRSKTNPISLGHLLYNPYKT